MKVEKPFFFCSLGELNTTDELISKSSLIITKGSNVLRFRQNLKGQFLHGSPAFKHNLHCFAALMRLLATDRAKSLELSDCRCRINICS